ncbi:MAG: FeoB-associated Cys-rich membrane protein [Planctomycetes bacterium]|nr:FeoB-associated Cys-rich membrane protein [Planctomycetota bacterium]
MSGIWQNLIVISIVAASALYLGLRMYRTLARRKASGCGGCGTCSQAPAAESPQIVPLEMRRDPAAK